MSSQLRPKQFWMTSTLQGRRWLAEQRLEAVEQNDVDRLEQLLSYQPSYRPRELTSFLQTALLKRSDSYAPCIKLLLEKGADPSETIGNGTPFLVVAADAGCVECLKLLASAGCDLDQARGVDGSTALHKAAWNGHCQIVEEMLKGGADVNVQDGQGRTPLLLAAQGEESEVIRLLIRYPECDVQMPDSENNSALHWAVAHEDIDNVTQLIRVGIDVNLRNEEGNSPLMLAAGLGSLDILQVLLNNGADVSAENLEGDTALLLSAKERHIECAKMLVYAGCDVNAHDETGATALLYMIHHDVKVVHILLEHGADPNVKDINDQTPIIIAVANNYEKVVKFLIAANCDPSGGVTSQKHTNSKHPLQIAIYNGMLDVIQSLYVACDASGKDLTWLTTYLHDSNLIQESRSNESVKEGIEWISLQLEGRQLINLQNLCRIYIRKYIGSKHFQRNIGKLPLPQALKSFICLTESIFH